MRKFDQKPERLISGELYQGPRTTYIPRGKPFYISSEREFVVYGCNHDGVVGYIRSSDCLQLRDKSFGLLVIDVPKTCFWVIYFQDDKLTYDVADPIPLATEVDSEPSVLDRMREMIRSEVMNRYGYGSDEVETLEEALDFDIDGDGEISSPHEYVEMVEEELDEDSVVDSGESVVSEDVETGAESPETSSADGGDLSES